MKAKLRTVYTLSTIILVVVLFVLSTNTTKKVETGKAIIAEAVEYNEKLVNANYSLNKYNNEIAKDKGDLMRISYVYDRPTSDLTNDDIRLIIELSRTNNIRPAIIFAYIAATSDYMNLPKNHSTNRIGMMQIRMSDLTKWGVGGYEGVTESDLTNVRKNIEYGIKSINDYMIIYGGVKGFDVFCNSDYKYNSVRDIYGYYTGRDLTIDLDEYDSEGWE